jgi:hypothetical protein
MKELQPFDYVPEYQPFEGEEVSFRLKPLDQRGYYEIQIALNESGSIGWDGIRAGARFIVGWKGDALGEFSRARVNEKINGAPDPQFILLVANATGELYRRAAVGDDEAKKS